MLRQNKQGLDEVADSKHMATIGIRAAEVFAGARGWLQGLALPFQAAGFLLCRPKLLALAIAPLIINLLVLGVIFGWAYAEVSSLLRHLLASHTGWFWQTLAMTIKILFWPIVLILIYFIFTPVALLIGSPFHDFLSEATEKACGLLVPERNGAAALMREIAYAIVAQAQRLLYYGFAMLLIFGLNLLPAVGSGLFLAASLYWTWRWNSFEFLSYAADRRRLSWKEIWVLLRARYAFSLGFGMMVTLLLYIPFLNALAFPVCAVAGALFFAMLNNLDTK